MTYEYKRHGTVSLLAGIDLLTGQVHALIKDRHRSREFIEFLKLLDAAYPSHTAIKLILDNNSAERSQIRRKLDSPRTRNRSQRGYILITQRQFDRLPPSRHDLNPRFRIKEARLKAWSAKLNPLQMIGFMESMN